MALTPQILAPQARTLVTVRMSTNAVQAPQARTLVAYGVPAETIDSSHAGISVTVRQMAQINVSEVRVLAAVRGRVSDPRVRAWTFTLDGHDFYVLKLGNEGTLIYDVLAEQWYEWGSNDDRLWRAYYGNNWLGGRRFAEEFGSNIIAGDDGNGALYFLNPMGHVDDDPAAGAEVPRPFLREIMGQIATRGYDMKSCYGVSLMGAIGEIDDATLTSITLSTSDDDGHTYDEHETLDVDFGEYQARVDWNSGLGSFAAPGRLFLIVDRGAFQRIDWLDMATDED